MNRKTILAALAGLCVSVAVCLAADANVGTWKLNEAKSKIAPGLGKNTSVTYTAEGDSMKCAVDGVLPDGKPAHNEWTGKFDGKDYPLVGDPSSDTRACKKIDDRTMEITNKKAGKVTTTGRVVISADGMTRTLTVTGNDAAGKKVTSTFVYEKQ